MGDLRVQQRGGGGGGGDLGLSAYFRCAGSWCYCIACIRTGLCIVLHIKIIVDNSKIGQGLK